MKGWTRDEEGEEAKQMGSRIGWFPRMPTAVSGWDVLGEREHSHGKVNKEGRGSGSAYSLWK
jgi:hypothetical protein